MNNSQAHNENSCNLSGQNYNSAGRDLNNNIVTNNYFINPKIHIDSAIETVLSGIYNITINADLHYKKPDTQPYTIEEKIEFNELDFFKDQFDDLMSCYPLIGAQIDAGTKNDLFFKIKINRYIVRTFNDLKVFNPTNSNNELIFLLKDKIEVDLKQWNAQLDADELIAIPDIIFYVFAECKIFKKPPKV